MKQRHIRNLTLILAALLAFDQFRTASNVTETFDPSIHEAALAPKSGTDNEETLAGFKICVLSKLVDRVAEMNHTHRYSSLEDLGRTLRRHEKEGWFGYREERNEVDTVTEILLDVGYGYSVRYTYDPEKHIMKNIVKSDRPQPSAANNIVSSRTPPPASARREIKSLLIVDDEDAMLETATARLKDMGYEVYTAGSMDTALGILNNINPDAIITDIVNDRNKQAGLNQVEGYYLALKARLLGYKGPIVACSGPGSDHPEAAGLIAKCIINKDIPKSTLFSEENMKKLIRELNGIDISAPDVVGLVTMKEQIDQGNLAVLGPSSAKKGESEFITFTSVTRHDLGSVLTGMMWIDLIESKMKRASPIIVSEEISECISQCKVLNKKMTHSLEQAKAAAKLTGNIPRNIDFVIGTIVYNQYIKHDLIEIAELAHKLKRLISAGSLPDKDYYLKKLDAVIEISSKGTGLVDTYFDRAIREVTSWETALPKFRILLKNETDTRDLSNSHCLESA